MWFKGEWDGEVKGESRDYLKKKFAVKKGRNEVASEGICGAQRRVFKAKILGIFIS